MMPVRRTAIATLSLLLLDIGAAEARRHPPRHRHYIQQQTASDFGWSQTGQTQESSTYPQNRLRTRDGGRPHRAWCGWYLRRHLGISDPRLNLARNWSRYYGRPHAGPCIGCVVVWNHHVGVITGFDGRNWIVHSGNDGGVVRTRPRSLAGAVFRSS
jgi:hypothetical protein